MTPAIRNLALVVAAAEPWHPASHALFPAPARSHAVRRCVEQDSARGRASDLDGLPLLMRPEVAPPSVALPELTEGD